MAQPAKYVAEGFMEDANRLFAEFAKKPDKEFKTFVEVWKKLKFIYILSGRPEEREYKDFVNEMYQLLLKYISYSSFNSQICAVYLLYALYRNQEILPTTKIRVNQNQCRVLKQLHLHAYENKLLSLHYIMDYIHKYAFDFVYHGSLYGPCSSKNRQEYATPKDDFFIQSDIKQGMTLFYESNVLKDLKGLHLQYLKKKEILLPNKRNVKAVVDVKKKYEEFDVALNCLINRQPIEGEGSENIGSRRLKLKNLSFEKRAMFRYLNHENEDLQEPELLPRKQPRQKRASLRKRRVGRPKKYEVETDEEDLSKSEESDDNKKNIEYPPLQKRGPIGRRKCSYLNNHDGPVSIETPKKGSEEFSDSSDDDDNESVDLVF